MGRPKKNKFRFFSFLHPILTVAVLTAFVLGISFLVKTIATSDSGDLLSALNPLLTRLHVDDKKLEAVAGMFVSRATQTGVVDEKKEVAQSSSSKDPNQVEFSIALLADSHGSYDNLGKALEMIKSEPVSYIFFLGDYTDLGVLEDLQQAKSVMDKSGLDYLSLPGDHDLWKSVGPQNFIDVFGKNYFSKTINGIKFVALDNSANYTIVSDEQTSWFKNELTDADFVLLSQPLYHPSVDRVMGIVNGQENQNVRFQAKEILKLIRESKVKAVIAGDQHLSSQNKDTEAPRLTHIVIGALTEERNLQTPRFAMFRALKGGDYAIEDVLLK